MKVLAIGVHPDDIEFGMGATLAKHIQLGHDILVVVLTDGKRDEIGNYTKSVERREESIRALDILGYTKEIKFLDLPKITVSQSTIKVLENIISEFKPKRIYTHSRNDRHQDHRKCSYAVLSAGRYISEILLYEIYSSLPEFVPNYLICFSKELLDLKIRANAEFKSQFKNMDLIAKMIEGMAIKNSFITYANQKQEIQYTEAFEIAKIVKEIDEV
ncbi:MAG: PIG-L deacetylase family protein [Candidatus Hermodarchaeota archaeon]